MNYHRRSKWTKPVQSQITKHVSYVFIIFLSIYKNVHPKRNRKPRNRNRKTRKANRKLEIARINKIKKIKRTRNNKKKDLEELEIGKTNETIAIILKEILLPYFLR